jgi:hypothetical protein
MRLQRIILTVLSMAITPALAEMTAGEYFARDKANNWTSEIYGSPYVGSVQHFSATRDNSFVIALVIRKARDVLGDKWVDTAVRIARLESGFNPAAVNRSTHASGVLQVIPSSARIMGYDPSRLTQAEYGIDAGIEHMRRCIDSGVSTPREMAACHVAGWHGWNKRLSRRYERYKHQYVRLAMSMRGI